MNIMSVRVFKASALLPAYAHTAPRTAPRSGAMPKMAGKNGFQTVESGRHGDGRHAAFPFELGIRGVHEIAERAFGDAPSATGFALAAAFTASNPQKSPDAQPFEEASGPIIWISQYAVAREHGGVSPIGVQSFLGVHTAPPILNVRTSRKIDALWAIEEALVSGAARLVIADIQDFDFTASRRLALASTRSGTPAILLKPYDCSGASAAAARWRIAPAPSTSNAFDSAAPGAPRWRAILERCRAAPHHAGKTFTIEYDNETASFRLASELASHTPHPSTDEGNETDTAKDTAQRIIHWPRPRQHAMPAVARERRL